MTKTLESAHRIATQKDILHEQISSTYFHKKTSPKRKTKSSKKKHAKRIIVFTAASACAALAVVPFASFLYDRYIAFLQHQVASAKVVALSREGAVDKRIVRSVEFRGAACGTSRLCRKEITLQNTQKYQWADLSLDFRFPIDASQRNLKLWAKGKTGGERIAVMVRDTRNRTSRLAVISLSSRWSEASIPFSALRRDIDLSEITNIRFEPSYVGESPGAATGIRDIAFSIKNITLAQKETGT